MLPRLTLAATLLATALLAPVAAQASCAPHPTLRDGQYVNVDRNARTITRLDLHRFCSGGIRSTGDGSLWINFSGQAAWRIQIWGSCSPRDCDWGQARVTESSNRQRLTGGYEQNFVMRGVTISPDGARLRVQVTSIYRDGRPASTWTETFRRR